MSHAMWPLPIVTMELFRHYWQVKDGDEQDVVARRSGKTLERSILGLSDDKSSMCRSIKIQLGTASCHCQYCQ
jgi:hypothetical protein